jgi:hypothetical protein
MWCAWEVPKRKSLRSSFEMSVGGTLASRVNTSSSCHNRPHALAAREIGSGRDARFIARPPHRTVRAAFPHTAPTSGV